MTHEATLRWRAIAEGLWAGRIIPFLGAGASAFDSKLDGECPPSGSKLLEMLADEAELSIQCSDHCKRLIYDLPRVASYYQLVTLSRPELDRRLRQLTGQSHWRPNRLHRLFARVALQRPLLVVTTNYDSLLEKAFDEEGASYEVVATAADRLAYRDNEDEGDDLPSESGKIYHRNGEDTEFEPLDPRDLALDLSRRSVIYKVHGSVPTGNRWPGGYLIAEEDYTRFLGRMDRNHIYPFKIKTIMRRREKLPNGRLALVHSLLFLGYSLNDWNLRVLMDELGVGQGAAGEERHYAILRERELVADRLLEKRNISPRYADLNTFVTELEASLFELSLPQSEAATAV